jgi:hypothetical protein
MWCFLLVVGNYVILRRDIFILPCSFIIKGVGLIGLWNLLLNKITFCFFVPNKILCRRMKVN